MTRHEGRTIAGGHRTGPKNTLRLRLDPEARMTGHVDGAWWPRSDDLPDELPDLLAVLSVRLGSVERVMYGLSEWAKAPARLMTGGRSVRLDGSRHQPANTLEVLGVGREGILLLVVPPSTDPDIAHEAMMTAAAPDNASTVGRHARDQRRRPRTAGRVLPTDVSSTRPQVCSMTVTATLRDGASDKYMRFGDVYVEHNDAALDVFRGGAKQAHSCASGEWTGVEGD